MRYSHLAGINIGSGPHYAEGWLNIDILHTHEGQPPDITMDIIDMPNVFKHHEFPKAYVGHVLEHIAWEGLTPIIQAIAHVATEIMVVGPCLTKAVRLGEPRHIIDSITAPDTLTGDPLTHQWTPTEELTAKAIRDAGYNPEILDIANVTKPEWPNPTTVRWQTAIRFTTGPTQGR